MRHEEKKVAKIVEELSMYFFAIGADNIQSCIETKEDQVKITMRANYRAEYRSLLHNFNEFLNEPKNDGIEDIYWELAGTGDPWETSQLLLIGMMIDKAEIKIEDEFVYLTLYKKLLK